MISRRSFGALAAGAALANHAVFAQEKYPDRPIRVIVPYAAGDGPDVVMRMLEAQLSPDLGTPMIVDNKPGATGALGLSMVARAKPDGYTLGYATSGHATLEALGRVELSPMVAISTVTAGGFVVVVAPDSPFASMDDLLGAIRAQPGRVSMGTGGVASPAHMTFETFALAVGGLEVNHVPFQGSGQLVSALLGGHVQFGINVVSSLAPMIRSGKLRALATSTAAPTEQVPGAPTLASFGAPGYSYLAWAAIVAPPGLPTARAQRLFDAVTRAAHSDAVVPRLTALGVTVATSDSLADAQDQIRRAVALEKQVVEKRGIRL